MCKFTLALIAALISLSARAQSPGATIVGTHTFSTNSGTGKTCTATQYSDETWTGCGLIFTAPTAAMAASTYAQHTLDGDITPEQVALTAAQKAAATAAQALAIPSVAMWQVKVTLNSQPSQTGVAGKTLLDDANTAVAAGPYITQIAWAANANVSRTSQALAAIAAAMGLTSAQVDTLFIAASQVTE